MGPYGALWSPDTTRTATYNLREFGKLPSSWPPARVGWGSAQTLLTPFPLDPADPADCSKIGDFIERVVIFGLDGAPA